MRTFLAGVLVGLLISLATGGSLIAPVVAQGVARMYGTTSAGVAVPVAVTSSGAVIAKLN